MAAKANTSGNTGAYATGISAFASIASGFVQADLVRRQAETQRSIDDFNAQLQDYDAWKVQGYGQELVARAQTQNDQVRGSTKVAAAALGVKVKDGSASEIVAQNELNSYLNIVDIDESVNDRVSKMKIQATNTRLNSDISLTMSNLRANAIQQNAALQAAGVVAAGAIRNQSINKDDINNYITNTNQQNKVQAQTPQTPSGYDIPSAVPQDTTVSGMQFKTGEVIVESLPTAPLANDYQYGLYDEGYSSAQQSRSVRPFKVKLAP